MEVLASFCFNHNDFNNSLVNANQKFRYLKLFQLKTVGASTSCGVERAYKYLLQNENISSI